MSLSSVFSRLSNHVVQQHSRIYYCRHFASLAPKKNLLNFSLNQRHMSDKHKLPKQDRGVWKILLAGITVGTGYALGEKWWKDQNDKAARLQQGHRVTYKDYLVSEEIPEWKVARSLRNAADNTKIKFTLYQYQTCPFCCKARAFLDYFGINYDVVEVNSVTRKQLKWSKAYKKVPILIAELEDGQKYQLVDSTAIISAMYSFLYDKPKGGLSEVLSCYPQIQQTKLESSKPGFEIENRYFLMYQTSSPNKDKKEILAERKWRKWVDDTLVHTLSPNVYRTPGEALQAFTWFDTAGDWPNHFKTWERYLVIYVGAAVMWIIGKKLKKKYQIKDDVRLSLYDEVNHWLKALKKKGTKFMGGDQPDLSDLAVYGVLSAIEGCDAFEDLMNNTKVGPWFRAVKDACAHSQGQSIFQ